MFRGMGMLAALLFAGGYVAGAFGPRSYSRTVSRPPAQVMAELRTLDIPAQPGAPGSTAEAAGGTKPLFRLATAGDRMTWYVMSGDKVATAMTAQLEPVNGGTATRIRTSVERGDAPDDLVSPAFRSNELAMALFGTAIEGRVNRLTVSTVASQVGCDKLFERLTEDDLAADSAGRPASFAGAMGDGARTIVRLNAVEAEMRRNGCDRNADGRFRGVEERTAPAEPTPSYGDHGYRTFTPNGRAGNYTAADRPMLDPTPAR